MLKSDLCDCSDAYIVVKGDIKLYMGLNNDDAYDKKFAFKNNAPFISCISKINNTLSGNVEDLHVVMPMYNLIEYRRNCSKAAGILWDYYRYDPNGDAVGNMN